MSESDTPSSLKTVADIIDFRETLEHSDVRVAPSGEWAYRGQPKDFNELTPSFQRQFSKKSIGTARIIEERLISAFRGHYNNLPDRSLDMPSFGQIDVGHDLRCLSVMQHYEIPTRLLDWTVDFWTAVYFACSNDPTDNAELWFYRRSIFIEQRNKDTTLMPLVDPSPNPPLEPTLLALGTPMIVELDPRITPRMRQQFAHHTVSTNVFSDHAVLIRVLDAAITPVDGPSSRFGRVLIDASCKAKALQFLTDSLNVNAGTIFPDVVGLGRFLRWQFDSLRTMML